MSFFTKINNETLNLFSFFINTDKTDVIIYNKPTEINFSLLNTTFVLLNIDKGLETLKNIEYLKVNYIFMLLISLNEFKLIFDLIYKNTNWNKDNIKFIVKFDVITDLDMMFKLSWDYYILNIIILQEDKFFTYFPYSEDSKCGENITSYFLGNLDSLKTFDCFPEKIPNNLQGCEVKLGAVVRVPFVINISEPRNDPNKAGFEVAIIHTISERLNFTEVYLKNDYLEYDHFDTKTFLTLYEMIKTRQLDIVYGYDIIRCITDYYLDSAVSHMKDQNLIWIPVRLQVPMWKKLIKIFQGQIWIFTILAFIINGFAFWIIGYFKQYNLYRSLSKCFLISWGILLNNTIKPPKLYILKVLILIWCTTSFVLNIGYTSKLISFLTDTMYEKNIRTVKQLINSDLKLGMDPSLEGYLDWNKTNENKLSMKKVSCDNFKYCLDQLVMYRNISILKNKRTMRYIIPRNYTDRSGKPLIVKLKILSGINYMR